MDYVALALKLWPLLEALRQAYVNRGSTGNGGPMTEAEARALLEQVLADLDKKIQDDLDSHPAT